MLWIVKELAAAVIMCGLNEKSNSQRGVFGFDLDCETSAMSILLNKNGPFKVISTDGGTNLSGEGFQSRMVNHYVQLCNQVQRGKDLTANKKAIRHLRRVCEMAKRMLTPSS